MDTRLQTFMELSAAPEIAGLCGDARAAWVWSADGSRILWANAAGAAFFSVRKAANLGSLDGLSRSPARPHIARIATSGSEGKPTIDRLRFYRGLRVMLLTCQCQRLTLDDGRSTALIICADKGLALGVPPFPAFLNLLSDDDTSAFLLEGGKLAGTAGKLDGIPEDLELPDGQRLLFGPISVDTYLHEGVLAQVSEEHRLILVENEVIAEAEDTEEGEPGDTEQSPVSANTLPVFSTSPGKLEPAEPSGASKTEGGDDEEAVHAPAEADTTDQDVYELSEEELDEDRDDEVVSGAAPSLLDEDLFEDVEPETEHAAEPVEDDADEENVMDGRADDAETAWGRAQDLDDPAIDDAGPLTAEAEPEDTSAEAAPADVSEPEEVEEASLPPLARDDSTDADETFRFSSRRRPVRFAWKMDIDQRFTFISEEFSETLGPGAAEVVGLTWQEVAEKFDLDVTGTISRALDRRDTWSGKTVDWPVSGAALRVPVDMAALPAFDRNREFEGYRGFGVCRTADAIADPLAPLAGTGTSMAAAPLVVQNEEEEDFDDTADTADSPESDNGLSQDTSAPEKDDNAEEPSLETGDPDAGEATDAPAAEVSEPTVSAETDVAESKEPETSTGHSDIQDLPPASAAPLEGKTLLGASAAALLGGLGFRPKPPVGDAENSKPQDTQPVETEVADEGTDIADAGESVGRPSEPLSRVDPTDGLTETPEDETAETGQGDLAATVDEDAEQSADQVDPGQTDLAGISGNAPLRAQEIETAVKTLAKDYGRKPQSELPLSAPSMSSDASNETGATASSEAPEALTQQEDEAILPAGADQAIDEAAAEATGEAAPADPAEQVFPATATSVLNASRLASAQLNLMAGENDNGPETSDTLPDETELTPDDGAPDDGKVVPLTRKPHLVPVDTSRLTKPEKAAFRKIAEALGARLEGDFDGDAIDDEIERELEAVEAPPAAGPIDPRLLDRLPIGIAIARDRDVLYANERLLDMLGYSDLKALREAGGLEAVFVEDDDDESFPDADGMVGTVDGTLRARLAKGGVRPVDARMHSVPWNGGRGLMISITERVAAGGRSEPTKPSAPAVVTPLPSSGSSMDLRQAEDRIAELDTILETATDGVLVLDRHGTITKANRSAEALFGASRSDIEGAPLTDYLAPESHRSAADYLDGLSRNGVASILNDGREVLGRVSSGGLIPLFMTIGRVSSSGDEPKFCAVLRDITQWKTAEEELTQAKRQAENASSQKSDFLAKISHEIRTPLNAIIGFSEVMMEERFGPIGNERYKEYLKDIRTSGSHIMSLINDLLDLSKIEAGKMDLHFSAVSANDVVSECVALMQPQANRERVIIRASLPDSVPSVVADQRSLRQIILNLLSNAIKFNKSGGQVIVSTSLEDSGEVVMRVRDTGTGMSAKDLASALEPFRQVHTARHGGGTGLGLPLTKALVEANRAGFHIDSTPDQGTLVEIRFPSQRVLAE